MKIPRYMPNRSTILCLILATLFISHSVCAQKLEDTNHRVLTTSETLSLDYMAASFNIRAGASVLKGVFGGIEATASGIYISADWGYNFYRGSNNTATFGIALGWLPEEHPQGLLLGVSAVADLSLGSNSQPGSVEYGEHAFLLNIGWLGGFATTRIGYTIMISGGIGAKYGPSAPFEPNHYYDNRFVPSVELALKYFIL